MCFIRSEPGNLAGNVVYFIVFVSYSEHEVGSHLLFLSKILTFRKWIDTSGSFKVSVILYDLCFKYVKLYIIYAYFGELGLFGKLGASAH